MLPGNDIFYVAEDLFDGDGVFRDPANRRAAERLGRRLDRMIRSFHGLAEPT